MEALTKEQLRETVEDAVGRTPVTDIHTHIYEPRFGGLLLWGIDELLTYHYLAAETLRWVDLDYERFWAMPGPARADLAWRTLFLEHSPVSEACRGVLTVLQRMGLDTGARDLAACRRWFAGLEPGAYVDLVFEKAGVKEVVMTNDPFDDAERPVWLAGGATDPRFRAALRIDRLLNDWPAAAERLRGWGYAAGAAMDHADLAEVRRFLGDWTGKTGALYLAASLPPSFRLPENSPRATLITECVLPVCRETNKPFALMVGVKKLVNQRLQLAGDGVGKSDIGTVEHLCAAYPENRFMVTLLARENQHELCVAARKFRNLFVFGCWWFLNTPLLVEEMTRMRLELLGTAFNPQHSDARVLDQLVYKWDHTRRIIARVLTDKYYDLAGTGWRVTEAEIRRDVADLFGGNFRRFLGETGA